MSEDAPWKVISAEELAASRRRAFGGRMVGSRSSLEGLLRLIKADIERVLADSSRSEMAHEIAEEHHRTLVYRVPVLLECLDEISPALQEGAYSCIYYLLWMMNDRKDGEGLHDHFKKSQAKKAREGKEPRTNKKISLQISVLSELIGNERPIKPSKLADIMLAPGKHETLQLMAQAVGLRPFTKPTLIRRLGEMRDRELARCKQDKISV